MAVVPAARPLVQIAAQSADIADLRGRQASGGLSQSGVVVPEGGMAGQGGDGSHRPDRPAAVLGFGNAGQARHRRQADHPIRGNNALFDFIQQIGAAGNNAGVRGISRRQQGHGGGQGLGFGVLKGAHYTPVFIFRSGAMPNTRWLL